EALYRSLNLVSIRLLRQVGIGNALNTLSDFGMPTQRFASDLSLALGSAAVTPLDMASSYSVFANGGYYAPAWFISDIRDNEGNLLWQAPEVVLCEPEDCGVNVSQAPATSTPLPEDDAIASPITTEADADEPAPE